MTERTLVANSLSTVLTQYWVFREGGSIRIF